MVSGIATESRLEMHLDIVITTGIIAGVSIAITFLAVGVLAQSKRLKTLVRAILFFLAFSSFISFPFWLYNWIGVVQVDKNPFIEYPALIGPYFSIPATFASLIIAVVLCCIAEDVV